MTRTGAKARRVGSTGTRQACRWRARHQGTEWDTDRPSVTSPGTSQQPQQTGSSVATKGAGHPQRSLSPGSNYSCFHISQACGTTTAIHAAMPAPIIIRRSARSRRLNRRRSTLEKSISAVAPDAPSTTGRCAVRAIARSAKHASTPTTLPNRRLREAFNGQVDATSMHATDNETLSLNTSVLVRTVNGADSKPRTTARDSRRLKQATARSKRNVRMQMSQLELQRRPDASRPGTRCRGQHLQSRPGPRGRRLDEASCQTTHGRVRRVCL